MLLQLNCFRFPEVELKYREIKELRLTESKPNLKKAKINGDKKEIDLWKTRDAYYKLILNSISGKLDEPTSWLYNNIPINIARIYGQLLLSRLVEECYLADIQVISVNT